MKHVMLIAALVLALFGQASAEEPAAKVELFAKEKWYADQKAKEAEFTGVLERNPAKVDPKSRNNPYLLVRTVDGQKAFREVFTNNAKADPFVNYVGKRVKIVGKAVEMPDAAKRIHSEVWPGRLELLGAAMPADPSKKPVPVTAGPRVQARYHWQATVDGDGAPQQVVVTDAEGLVKAIGDPDKAKDAGIQEKTVESLAQSFKVKAIDWNKQMVVVVGGGVQPSNGFTVDVPSIDKKGDNLVVRWKVQKPKPGTSVTEVKSQPTLAILIDKSAAEVQFDPPTDKKDAK